MKKWMLIVLAACGSGSEPKSVTPPVVASAPKPVVSVAATASSAPPIVATARAPLPAWSKEPEASGDLFTVMDGYCGMNVSPLPGTTLVNWRHDSSGVVARLTADGLAMDPKLSVKALYRLHRFYGSMDHLYAEGDNGGRCNYRDEVFRLDGEKWVSAFALPEDVGVSDLQPYGDGMLGLRECVGCGDDHGCVSKVLMGDNAKAPSLSGDGFVIDDYKSLPDSTVIAVGAVCKDNKCDGQIRWQKPGAKVSYLSLGTSSGSHGALHVESPTEVYVARNPYVGVFDGQKLTKIATSGTIGGLVPLAKGVGIVVDHKLFRRDDNGSLVDITPPKFTGLVDKIDGFRKGSAWMIGEKGSVFRQTGGEWKEVTLPAPARAANPKSYVTPESIWVVDKDDAIIIGSYFEKHDGWVEAEKRNVLLRSKRPHETLRCDANGFGSWPAAAQSDCKTPFVVLAEVSPTSPKDFDFPKTRATFKPYASKIENGALVEVEANGKRWVGLVPTTVEVGNQLVTLYSSQVAPMHPEMVCVAPEHPRLVPLSP